MSIVKARPGAARCEGELLLPLLCVALVVWDRGDETTFDQCDLH